MRNILMFAGYGSLAWYVKVWDRRPRRNFIHQHLLWLRSITRLQQLRLTACAGSFLAVIGTFKEIISPRNSLPIEPLIAFA